MKPIEKMTPFELGESGDQNAIKYLINYLRSEKYNEKRLAASALEKLDKKQGFNILPAKSSLIINCADPKPQIRQYSLKALKRLVLHLSQGDFEKLKNILQGEEKEYNIKLLKEIIRKYNKNQSRKEKETKLQPKTSGDYGSRKNINKFIASETNPFNPLNPNSYVTIICLAKSRKYGGYCIAGKELIGDKIGKWIRPVSGQEHGELTNKNIRCSDGSYTELLDIVSIPILRHNPITYQTENVLIDESKPWIKRGRWATNHLTVLCDKVDKLWVNNYHSYSGRNDRIPASIARETIKFSLTMIKVNHLSFIVKYELRKKKVRAAFRYHGIDYNLVVTDTIIEQEYRRKLAGKYPINKPKVHICISLGEVFEEYCYKLVASVFSG